MSEFPPAVIEAIPPPLSEVEIRNEINSLTAGERTKLVLLARLYIKKGKISKTSTAEEPDELLQEAICRVLDGVREWPRGLDKIRFLAGVIKSIAGDRERALRRDLKWTVPPKEEKRRKEEVGDRRRRGTFDHEGAEARGILAQLDIKRILSLFDDDRIAQNIVLGMMDGVRGEDLQRANGLSPTEYESKRKKIRRRIEKLKT